MAGDHGRWVVGCSQDVVTGDDQPLPWRESSGRATGVKPMVHPVGGLLASRGIEIDHEEVAAMHAVSATGAPRPPRSRD